MANISITDVLAIVIYTPQRSHLSASNIVIFLQIKIFFRIFAAQHKKNRNYEDENLHTANSYSHATHC